MSQVQHCSRLGMLALSVCLSVWPSAFPLALASWTQDISIIPGNPLRCAALLGTHSYKQEPLSFYSVTPLISVVMLLPGSWRSEMLQPSVWLIGGLALPRGTHIPAFLLPS